MSVQMDGVKDYTLTGEVCTICYAGDELFTS